MSWDDHGKRLISDELWKSFEILKVAFQRVRDYLMISKNQANNKKHMHQKQAK